MRFGRQGRLLRFILGNATAERGYSMKTVIFTMGTRGDVQPYIYLSRALKKNGHDVKLGSHPCWKKLIEDAGVSFLPIGPDRKCHLIYPGIINE